MDQQITPHVEEQSVVEGSSDSHWTQLRDWMRNQLPWWSMSFTVHVAALASLLLLGRYSMPAAPNDDIASFLPPEQIEHNGDSIQPFEVGPRDVEPKPIDPETPAQILGSPNADPVTSVVGPPGDPRGNPEPSTNPGTFPGGIDLIPGKPGPGPGNPNAHWPHDDTTFNPDNPYDGRPKGGRPPIGPPGMTHDTERAVVAAIYWLGRHQSRDGSWSLQDYVKMCHDNTCTGVGGQESLSAATAMGVLPFLGVGQTHLTKGKFQSHVARAIYWLVGHQKPDGDLSAGTSQQMYSHALATIALCEDYGMTRDKSIGVAAQRAINFIVAAQNSKTGGWRYHPGDEGDTSVTGWQLMALKSGQMAKLTQVREFGVDFRNS